MLTIVHPLTGAKLQVANQDFFDEMTWNVAKKACSELGSGWRLPTIEELKAMYEQLHRKGQGNFKSTGYWSSTETSASTAFASAFGSGGSAYPHNEKTISTYRVRAVRAC